MSRRVLPSYSEHRPLTLRILLLTAYFPPDNGSAAHLFSDLGEALVERGHRVTVVTGMPSYYAQGPLERYKGKVWLKETVNGVDVVRVSTLQLTRRLMVGRALSQFSTAAALFFTGLMLPPHDVALVYSPPLPLGLTAWGLQSLRGIPFVLNVQDLFPQSIIDLGLLKNRWFIRLFEAMERFVYQRASAITVHSGGNREHIFRRGGARDRVTVIPNWVDTELIQPAERMNWFRREHALGDTFVVSFAGVLGYSQDLDVVLEAARLVNHQPSAVAHPPILWLIVGDGVERSRLETKALQMGLHNILFLSLETRDRYPAVLHASDVCLVTLHAKVKTPVVPSKILSIMAAGRPVVAALDLNGDASRFITEAQCGLCVPPEDPHALAEAVLRLYRDASMREDLGRNGRQYAERHLSLDACVPRYEELLRGLMKMKAGDDRRR